jgi:hypothetical protein
MNRPRWSERKTCRPSLYGNLYIPIRVLRSSVLKAHMTLIYRLIFLVSYVSLVLSLPAYCENNTQSTEDHSSDLDPIRSSKDYYPYLRTNNTYFTIHRHGLNISLDIESYVKGTIGQIRPTPRGRSIEGYHSRYVAMGSKETLNGALIMEKTSARKGAIEAQDVTHLQSSSFDRFTKDDLKSEGDTVITTLWREKMPMFLVSRRDVTYSGTEINDQDLAYNNLDFVGSSFLYATDLWRARDMGIQLERLNVTLLTTGNTTRREDATFSVQFKPTKSMIYREDAQLSGLARIKYRQAGIGQTSMLQGMERVTSAAEGDETFFGDYNLKIGLEMRSKDELNNLTDRYHWLDCSYQDPQDIDVVAWDETRNIYPDQGVAINGRHRSHLF